MARLSDKRREEWDQQMRDLICEAAVYVLTEHGFEGLTMDRVAQTAKVAKGTLYNYFKDKNELLGAMQQAVYRDVREQIPPVVQSSLSPVEKLRAIATLCLESLQAQRTVVLAIFRSTAFSSRLNEARTENRQYVRGVVAGIIRDGIESGTFRMANPARVADIFVGALLGLAESQIDEDAERPTREDIAALMNVVFNGILTPGRNANRGRLRTVGAVLR